MDHFITVCIITFLHLLTHHRESERGKSRGGRLYRLLEKRIFEFFFLSGRIFEEYSNILEHKEMHKETYFNLAFI